MEHSVRWLCLYAGERLARRMRQQGWCRPNGMVVTVKARYLIYRLSRDGVSLQGGMSGERSAGRAERDVVAQRSARSGAAWYEVYLAARRHARFNDPGIRHPRHVHTEQVIPEPGYAPAVTGSCVVVSLWVIP